MSEEQWNAVDQYINSALIAPDEALEAALHDSTSAGIPAINVAPNQGKLLYLLAKLMGAKRILEIGTLGGYSTIWLARALPVGGHLTTLEFDPMHADVASSNIARAGLSETVDVRVGPALETLPLLLAEGAGPFDFVFIDADKANNPGYINWALRLTRLGSLIICDNVVRDGKITDLNNLSPDVVGTRLFFQTVAAEPRLSATAVQTVGSKGYDGFAMALVVAV